LRLSGDYQRGTHRTKGDLLRQLFIVLAAVGALALAATAAAATGVTTSGGTTVSGGVATLVSDQSKVELESSMNALQLSISGPDKLCRHE
jgi:phosphate-selective porin